MPRQDHKAMLCYAARLGYILLHTRFDVQNGSQVQVQLQGHRYAITFINRNCIPPLVNTL